MILEPSLRYVTCKSILPFSAAKCSRNTRRLCAHQRIGMCSQNHENVYLYAIFHNAFGTGGKVCINIDDTNKAVQIPGKRGQKTFAFDRIFNQKAKQDEVYNIVAKDLVESCIKGYNCSCFAVSTLFSECKKLIYIFAANRDIIVIFLFETHIFIFSKRTVQTSTVTSNEDPRCRKFTPKNLSLNILSRSPTFSLYASQLCSMDRLERGRRSQ